MIIRKALLSAAVASLWVAVAPPVGGAHAAAAAVRLVSMAGTDVGHCSSSPCRTITYAIGQASSGDTISIAAGTYTEHLIVDRSLRFVGAGQTATVIDGSASGRAVTIGAPSSSLTVTITKLAIRNGLAATGGGIMSAPGSGFTNTATITKSTILANSASRAAGQGASGGGVYNGAGSTMQILSSIIQGNSAIGGAGAPGIGGGIYSAGPLSIDRSTLTGNRATGGGRPPVSGGAGGTGSGGAIDSTGPLIVTRSTISGNVASGGEGAAACTFPYGGPGGDALGGSIVADSTLTFINSTIAGNQAEGGPGGSQLPWPHCHARGGSGGAALSGAILAGSTLALINSTIAANQALGGPPGCGASGCGTGGTGVGGGIDLITGSADLTNTILAGNSAANGPDCNGTVTSSGHNLLGSDSSCAGFTGPGDLVNVDPLLSSLQNNGGPTLTMALGAGSPAVDAADDVVCTAPPVNGKDQRGQPRPGGAHCDVGAFEVEP